MKVLLVRVRPHPQSVNLQSFMVCEPLELEYVYAALKAHGHEVEILDMILDKRSFARVLKGGGYELVCFTGYITHVGEIKRHARAAKKILPRCMTAVGGVHAEVVPADFEDESIDCILWANGLDTICSIVDGCPPKDVPGVYWVGTRKVVAMVIFSPGMVKVYTLPPWFSTTTFLPLFVVTVTEPTI